MTSNACRHLLALSTFIVLGAACGDDASPVMDASVIDVGRADAGEDAALEDAATDAPSIDAPLTDASSDTPASDGSVSDASMPDAEVADTSAPDACTPESDPDLCTAASAECGVITVSDRCGTERTPTCGTCTLPETCGGLTANECGCAEPTEVRSATCAFTSSGFRLTWGGDTTTYSYTWSSGATPPTSCGGAGSSALFGSVGANSQILPGGPSIGECWFVRLCTWEPMCTADYSPGVVFQACVNGSGTSGTCSAM